MSRQYALFGPNRAVSLGSAFGEVQASTVSKIFIRPHTKRAPIHPERLKDLLLLEVTKTHARNPLFTISAASRVPML